ncbi:MAG TPA: dephospho-CoA kinase [Ilumatobacter sp.]|nr:dephospho-CoA kinase [Ilumatobacter sp.]
MHLVGLTGGIGSGKSTVSALLAEHGARVVDADQIARDLQSPGSPLLAAMAERFGAHILRSDGSLDRAAVAALVFGESDEARQALRDLNGITHPAIQAEIAAQIATHADTDEIVILDFPLLGENPRDDLAATVVVDIPADVAVERLVGSRGMDEADARNRIASQISREERLGRATHVVDNSGDLDALRDQVESLWKDLHAKFHRASQT